MIKWKGFFSDVTDGNAEIWNNDQKELCLFSGKFASDVEAKVFVETWTEAVHNNVQDYNHA